MLEKTKALFAELAYMFTWTFYEIVAGIQGKPRMTFNKNCGHKMTSFVDSPLKVLFDEIIAEYRADAGIVIYDRGIDTAGDLAELEARITSWEARLEGLLK